MDRFPTQQSFDRRGPAVGAPADGLRQGMVYTAVIRSVPTSDGLVQVSVPVLHLSSTFLAHIQPGTPCKVGETCVVSLDENKLPWVTTGLWKALSLSTLEAEIVALTPGPWEPLIINSAKCEAGSATPECRKEPGNVLRFRGAIKVKAGQEIVPTFENAPKLANLPAGLSFGGHSVYHPAVHFVKLTPIHTSSSVLEFFQTEVEICGGETLKSEDQVDFDGVSLTYP